MSKEKELFSSHDPKILIENLETVIGKHFEGNDMSFYAPTITLLLYSEEKRIQILALRVLSLILTPQTDVMDIHIDILQTFLKTDEINIHTLKFLSFIQNDFIYSRIREDVIDYFQKGQIYIRKLAFFVIFAAVKRSRFWIQDFLSALSRSLFDAQLYPYSIQMMTELYSKVRLPFDTLLLGLLPDILKTDYLTYSKFCILFSRNNGDYLIDAIHPFLIKRFEEERVIHNHDFHIFL